MKTEHGPALNLSDEKLFQSVIKRSRKAQKSWQATSFTERSLYLDAAHQHILKNLESYSEIISQHTGKTKIDILAGELIPCLMACRWYAKNTKKILKPRTLKTSTPLFFNKKSAIYRVPQGVVAIISPWNYPLAIPFSEIIMGLMAGNSIILKGSPVTPQVTQVIQTIFEETQLPGGLFQVVDGPGPEVSSALFQGGIDKLFFTGSVSVGRQLMAKAAETLTPLVLELGGKDPMLVLEDADLERASNGALWGAFQNAGQTCAGIERLYIAKKIYPQFLKLLSKKIKKLRIAKDQIGEIGKISTQKQYDSIKQHVDLALAQGASIYAQAPDPKIDKFYPPTIINDVNHSMKIMQEETFGPILGVMPFDSIDQAINLANDSVYALSASVWTKNKRLGLELCQQVEAGVCTINDHLFTHALSEAPWGGSKNSGQGRTHGQLGLEEMTRSKLINWDLLPGKSNLYWYPHSEATYQALLAAAKTTSPIWLEQVKSFKAFFPHYLKKTIKPWQNPKH